MPCPLFHLGHSFSEKTVYLQLFLNYAYLCRLLLCLCTSVFTQRNRELAVQQALNRCFFRRCSHLVHLLNIAGTPNMRNCSYSQLIRWKKHPKGYLFYFWEITAMHFFFWTIFIKTRINLAHLFFYFLILFLRICLGRSSFKNSLLFDCKLEVSQLNFWIWKKMQHQLFWNYNGMKPSKHSLKGHLTSSKIRWGVNHWNTKCGFEMEYLILENRNLRQGRKFNYTSTIFWWWKE